MNMTNLHFHGLTVSPNAPQDDVIGMLAVNRTGELHPFHIHHVHFLAYAENSVPLAHPAWLDTVNVPYRSSVDVILDFSDPVIKGISVFHCPQAGSEREAHRKNPTVVVLVERGYGDLQAAAYGKVESPRERKTT